MKCDIVIIVDHKWRDLPGMALLAAVLEKDYGYSVRLIPYSLWQEALVCDRPQVLCVSVLYGKRGKEIIRVCKEIGTKIAVIMTEGRPNLLEGMRYTTGRGSNSKYADLWFTWSDTVRNFMIEEGVLPPEKIVTAGSNRFDIYKEPYNAILIKREKFILKYGLNPNLPVISWATNFTNAKFYKKNSEFLIKDWNDLGLTKYKSYSNPLEVAKLDWETRKESARVMKEALRALPNVQLMVKPHPSENHKFYEDFAAECGKEFGNRVAFIGFEYIWDLLNAADIHIHRLCTTGVEAWFLDVPSIELHVKDYAPWSIKLPGAAAEAVKGNDIVTSADGLIERINYYLKGGNPSERQYKSRQEYIEKWLDKMDGKRTREYAGHLNSLVGSKRKIKKLKLNRLNLKIYAKTAITKMLGNNPREKLKFWKLKKSKIDHIGHVDKVIVENDIAVYSAKMREIVKDRRFI